MNFSDISQSLRAVSSLPCAITSCFWKRAVRLEDIQAVIRKKPISATSFGFIIAKVCTGTVKK